MRNNTSLETFELAEHGDYLLDTSIVKSPFCKTYKAQRFELCLVREECLGEDTRTNPSRVQDTARALEDLDTDNIIFYVNDGNVKLVVMVLGLHCNGRKRR